MAVKVLDESVGKVVLIKLKGGKVIRGILQGFDQYMNLSLERAEEVNEDGKSNSLGTLIVRGDKNDSYRERSSLFGADEALRGGDRGEDNERGEGDDHEEVHHADKIVRIETQGRGACRRGRGAREVEGRPDVPLQG